jgi:hypothetical protein
VVDSAANKNEYHESSWGIKGCRRVRLTISVPFVSRLSRKCAILDVPQRYFPVTSIAMPFYTTAWSKCWCMVREIIKSGNWSHVLWGFYQLWPFLSTVSESFHPSFKWGWRWPRVLPVHTARTCIALLRDVFGQHLISRDSWPPRSSDLSPSDFYLLRAMKASVYKDNSHSVFKHPSLCHVTIPSGANVNVSTFTPWWKMPEEGNGR